MPRQLSEAHTRKELIDPQLEKAGWYLRDHSKVKIEIPILARPEGFVASAQPSRSETCFSCYNICRKQETLL